MNRNREACSLSIPVLSPISLPTSLPFAPAANDQYEPTYEVFVERGESVPFQMPMIWMGIDVSYVMEQFMRDVQAGTTPLSALDSDEVNKHLRRRS
jgi:hypothetical protein